MNKIFRAFIFYWHYSLDTLLTHVYVIAFLMAGYPTLSAFLMSVDSIFKAILSIPLSRLSVYIPLYNRGKVSMVLKALLVVTWFSAISFLPINKSYIAILIPFVIFKLIIFIDSFVSADFIFRLKTFFGVDLSQSVAAQNILVKASVFVAPALALLILKYSYMKLIILLIAILITSLSFYFLKIIFHDGLSKNIKNPVSPHVSFSTLMKNSFMRWGFAYQILANLAFAGVSFLLLKNLNPHGNLFLNQITMLYLAFLLVQLIVLIYGDTIILINSVAQIAISIGLTAIAVLVTAALGTSTAGLLTSFIIGLIYSITLSATQKIVTAKLRGEGYLEYIGLAQTVGRLSSFSSTILLGYGLSVGFTSAKMLCVCGVLGILSAVILKFIPIPSTQEES